jgi:hypothetical protein
MNVRDPLPPVELDAQGLADMLGLSSRTIVLRAKYRPWSLPPRAVLHDHEILRWRQDGVTAWLAWRHAKRADNGRF